MKSTFYSVIDLDLWNVFYTYFQIKLGLLYSWVHKFCLVLYWPKFSLKCLKSIAGESPQPSVNKSSRYLRYISELLTQLRRHYQWYQYKVQPPSLSKSFGMASFSSSLFTTFTYATEIWLIWASAHELGVRPISNAKSICNIVDN